jgi:hypothetical protein
VGRPLKIILEVVVQQEGASSSTFSQAIGVSEARNAGFRAFVCLSYSKTFRFFQAIKPFVSKEFLLTVPYGMTINLTSRTMTYDGSAFPKNKKSGNTTMNPIVSLSPAKLPLSNIENDGFSVYPSASATSGSTQTVRVRNR